MRRCFYWIRPGSPQPFVPSRRSVKSISCGDDVQKLKAFSDTRPVSVNVAEALVLAHVWWKYFRETHPPRTPSF